MPRYYSTIIFIKSNRKWSSLQWQERQSIVNETIKYKDQKYVALRINTCGVISDKANARRKSFIYPRRHILVPFESADLYVKERGV